jgi:hypothetical protein
VRTAGVSWWAYQHFMKKHARAIEEENLVKVPSQLIVPETEEQLDPVSYAPSLAKEIEDEYGKTALEGLQKIGFKFENELGA